MPQSKQKFVLINIAKQQWALPLMESSNFFALKNIVPVPGVDPRIMGLTYHQSHIITVLDTFKFLGLGSSVNDQQCVRVDYQQDYYGLLINAASSVVTAPKILTDKSKRDFQKYFLINQKKVYILSIEELVSKLHDHD